MPPEEPGDRAAIIVRAEVRAKERGMPFRGVLTPSEAWTLFPAVSWN